MDLHLRAPLGPLLSGMISKRSVLSILQKNNAEHARSRSIASASMPTVPDLKEAPRGSRAHWPFMYACDMDFAFCRIEGLKGSGMSNKEAFGAVIGSSWSSSTFSDHHRVWKTCPSNEMMATIQKGRQVGGEWKLLTSKYRRPRN